MTSQEIAFDTSTSIGVCLDHLLRLKAQNKSYDPMELWAPGILSGLNHLEHWSKGLSLISEAQDSLRSLAGVKDLLKSLLESHKATTSAITTALLPFQRGKGLHSLPNDVLSMIFVFAVSGPRSRTSLNLVCRRFREVASGIPQLWSTIKNCMSSMGSMRLVHASLKESKAVGLDIELFLYPAVKGSWLDALQVVDASLAYIAQWEHLSVSSLEVDSWQELGPCITQLGERTKNIHVPRLRSLSVEFSADLPQDEGVPDRSESAIHFYRTWTLPSLRHLEAHNFIPVPLIAPSLTSLSIELGAPFEYFENPRHSLRRLLDFLSSIPNLEDLNLSLEWLNVESIPSPVVLHHLKTFRVHFAFWSPPQVSLFAKAVTTPTIRSLYIFVEGQSDPGPTVDPPVWLSSFFFGCGTYPTLEEFTFKFNDEWNNFHDSDFAIPFEKFPNLCALTLDSDDWSPGIFSSGIIPPLRSLHLKGRMDYNWTYWLSCVRERMHDQGKLQDLKDMSVTVWRSPSEDCVKEVSKFPNSRIIG